MRVHIDRLELELGAGTRDPVAIARVTGERLLAELTAGGSAGAIDRVGVEMPAGSGPADIAEAVGDAVRDGGAS